MDYRQTGVNIDAGNETVRRIKDIARGTFTPAVLSNIGSFGGLFRFDTSRFREPVLVSSADGVGTKLKLAFLTEVHHTVGLDLVNHCVNDILVHGAEPLFFLDYLATGRLVPEVAEEIVRGISIGCRDNECALIGGETAELPGFYADGEYDLAGFIVGVVDRGKLIDGTLLRPGDALIGLPSTGLHTNGYSLARRIVFEEMKLSVGSFVRELGSTIGEVLLAPHRSYLKVMRPLLARSLVEGIAHVTGGGITDNLPRILPEGVGALINRVSWTVPPIFEFLRANGSISDAEMFRSFNMGIGLIVACRPEHLDEALDVLQHAGELPRDIGRLCEGDRTVVYA